MLSYNAAALVKGPLSRLLHFIQSSKHVHRALSLFFVSLVCQAKPYDTVNPNSKFITYSSRSKNKLIFQYLKIRHYKCYTIHTVCNKTFKGKTVMVHQQYSLCRENFSNLPMTAYFSVLIIKQENVQLQNFHGQQEYMKIV